MHSGGGMETSIVLVQSISWINDCWPIVKNFLNSSFTTALAGAFSGAWGAHYIAERSRHREQLLIEIRNINKAHSLAFNICNHLISMKKQHIKGMSEKFIADNNAVQKHLALIGNGVLPKTSTFHFVADFQSLSLPILPTEVLQNVVMGDISSNSKIRLLTVNLVQTINSFESSLSVRNNLINLFKNDPHYKENLYRYYFGFPINGNLDRNYPDVIEAMSNQTDDGIFFSNLLCKELNNLGTQTAKKFNSKFRAGAPNVEEADFSKAEKSDLMPDQSNYKDWLEGFYMKEDPPNRWKAIKKAFESWRFRL